jgi:hypothetical protein
MLSPFAWYVAVGICAVLLGRLVHEWIVGHALCEAGMRPGIVRRVNFAFGDMQFYRTLCEREGKSLRWWWFFIIYYGVVGFWLLGIVVWLCLM